MYPTVIVKPGPLKDKICCQNENLRIADWILFFLPFFVPELHMYPKQELLLSACGEGCGGVSQYSKPNIFFFFSYSFPLWFITGH